jgi:hypothetical protein
MEINAREANADFWVKSDVLSTMKHEHHPFLLWVGPLEVKIIKTLDEVLDYPDDSFVIKQWKGEWRSDFFQFSVADIRSHIQT